MSEVTVDGKTLSPLETELSAVVISEILVDEVSGLVPDIDVTSELDFSPVVSSVDEEGLDETNIVVISEASVSELFSDVVLESVLSVADVEISVTVSVDDKF